MKKLNSIEIPPEGFGRAFQFKENGPHFAGPITLQGIVYACKVWKNTTKDGREYLRMIFETPEESGLFVE